MQKICTLKNIGKNSAKNMHYCICTFGGCQFFQKIIKNLEKSAYFLHIFCHISLKIKENCQKLAICKKYAENMRKICTFPKIFGKGQNSQKLQKTSRKVHIFCIFFAYSLAYFIKHQRKLPKIGNMQKIRRKYAENMHFSRGFLQFLIILTFLNIFGKVHIFRIFSAYFLHIANF